MDSKHILLVEDDPATADAMKRLLQRAGYAVTCAANGREALDSLRGAEQPSLILLDLTMPGMDGWEFRERQRHAPGLASIPVVVLSDESNLPYQVASLGVVDFLPKPVQLTELLDAIERHGK